jgi:hypothetical protein
MKWPHLLGAVLVWSVLAWMFIFAFAGSHVCSILTTGANGPLTQEEMDQQIDRCNRPDIGAIAVFSVGYVVLAGVAIGTIRDARRTPRGWISLRS